MVCSAPSNFFGFAKTGWLLGLMLLVAVTSTARAQEYTIVDLGTLGGTSTTANGINNNGLVVGQSYLAGDASRHAFGFANGAITDLGTLGGVVSGALAVNDNGQIVGTSAVAGNTANHAFVKNGENFTDLGTLGGPDSTAYAINNQGQIVGSSRISGGSADHAFLYSGGNMVDLGTLGGAYSFAFGINSSGQIVGEASLPSNYNRAFLYADGTMTDLGTLGGEFSKATAINDNGQIAGWSLTQQGSLARRAFIYANGTMTDIGNPSDSKWSMALAINNHGEVVGSTSEEGENYRAFLYSEGVMQDLNSLLPVNSGWVLTSASGINNNRQIIGEGTFNGTPRAFLLSPAAPTDSWTFTWPAPNSVWTRAANIFSQAETDSEWTFSASPTLWRWSFISGSITSQDNVPRLAFALVTDDQSLNGLLLQFRWFPVVTFSGSKNP